MKKKYLIKTNQRNALLGRLMAKGLDLFCALIISTLLYPFGLYLSILYIAFADALKNGQSIGKKILGFSVTHLETGKSCSFKMSAIRNLPIIVPLIFSIIPLWGWAFSLILGVPLILLEIYLLSKLDSGLRLGDVMADTVVKSYLSSDQDFGKHWFKKK